MDPARWRQVRNLFDEVVELAPAERAARLAAVGRGDPVLRRDVERLLAGDAEVDDRLAPIEFAFGSMPAEPPTRSAGSRDPLGLAGRTIAHFRVIEPLAIGGMGMVYRAEDTRLQRAIALKLPLQEVDGRARERFLREARAAGALDHPNVCSIYEVGESDDGHLYLAMPLCPGETLRARLARDGALAVPLAVDIARAIARGLDAAHAAGIVHRDVKPGNVMLLPDGGVKVLDFGLASMRDLEASASRATAGTISYMAPEQIRGERADARADLWALGVVLYEMLTGRRPFDGPHEGAIGYAVVHTEPVHPLALRAELPPALDAVVRALLHKDRERRPPTAEAVHADLATAALGRRSRVASWGWFARRWARPARRAVPIGAASLLVVVTAGVAARRAVGGGEAAATAALPVAALPTSNADAYDYYQRGVEFERRPFSVDNVHSAQSLYLRALALDSTFALARARLAITRTKVVSSVSDSTLGRPARARDDAEAALRMQPGLAEGHLALGHVLLMEGDRERGLEELQRAAVGMPTEAEPQIAIAAVHRTAGRLEEAVARFERAARLDPRDLDVLRQLAFSQSRMRRYEAGTRSWERVIALAPDDHESKLIRAYLFLRWHGSADTLAAVLRRLPPDWDQQGLATWARFSAARIQRRPAAALAAADAARHEVSFDGFVYRPRTLMRAQSYAALGDRRRARAHYDTARAQIENSLVGQPNAAKMHIALGLAYAGLGRRREALAAGRRAMALAPMPGASGSGSAVTATATMGGAAEVFAAAGDADGAIALLERLLGMPAGREASVPLLRVDPAWDPLRGDPRFERLLRRFAPLGCVGSDPRSC